MGKKITWVHIVILAILLCVLLGFLFSLRVENIFPWSIVVNNSMPEHEEIKSIIAKLSYNTSDIYEVARRTSKFVDETIYIKLWDDSSCQGSNFFRCYTKKYPCIRGNSRGFAPYLLNSKCGACGEHALLFAYLMEEMGYQAGIISLQREGGDHAVNEIWKGKESVIVDASQGVFNESRSGEMYPAKKIYGAELRYLNGTKIDYTKLYADESAVLVNLTFINKGKPLRNHTISFYSGGLYIKSAVTDDGGSYAGYLGNNLTYSVSYSGLYSNQDLLIPPVKEITKTIEVKTSYTLILIIGISIILILSVLIGIWFGNKLFRKNRA